MARYIEGIEAESTQIDKKKIYILMEFSWFKALLPFSATKNWFHAYCDAHDARMDISHICIFTFMLCSSCYLFRFVLEIIFPAFRLIFAHSNNWLTESKKIINTNNLLHPQSTAAAVHIHCFHFWFTLHDTSYSSSCSSENSKFRTCTLLSHFLFIYFF